MGKETTFAMHFLTRLFRRPAPLVKLVFGLPGAGKTTWFQSVRRDQPPAAIFDDFMKDSLGGRPGFANSQHWPVVEECLARGAPTYLCDIELCRRSAQEDLVQELLRRRPEARYQWIHVATPLETCLGRIASRARGSASAEMEKARQLAQRLHVPAGAIVLIPETLAPAGSAVG